MPKLPPYNEWKPSWEVKEEDFDAEMAKKSIYDLLARDATRLTEIDSLKADSKKVTGELDELKKASETAEQTAKREREESAAKAGESEQLRIVNMKLEVALEKGLSLVQQKRLIGTTKEELSADADQLLEDFGAKVAPVKVEDSSDDESDTENVVSLQRVPKLFSPGDPSGGTPRDLTQAEILAALPRPM